MTHWRDPTVVTAENFALVKLMHVLGGVYIWEFVSNLGFEYSIITGKRKFTWTFPLYWGCRWCPLFAIIFEFIGFDVSSEIDCQAWVISAFTFAYLSFAFASALIVLRVIAFWDRNKIAVALASVSWLANIGFYAYSAATSVAVWNGNSCTVLRTEHGKIAIFSTLASDLVLLVLMIAGLLRWKNARRIYGIWWFLCTQGFVWVLLVTLAEVPPMVFVLLDLNDPLNLMFQIVALVIVSVGASRLYRGLVDHPALGYDLNEDDRNGSPEELSSVNTASLKKDCLTQGAHITGGPMIIPNGQSFMVVDFEVAKRKDDNDNIV